MKFNIDFKYAKKFVGNISNEIDRAMKLDKELSKKELSHWMTLPNFDQSSKIDEIDSAANELKKRKHLLVIGIGGSYLGTKAAIDFLGVDNDNIFFLGNNVDPQYFSEVMNKLDGKDFNVNVISKSGSTLEPIISFGFIENILKQKYPNSYQDRIFVTTERDSYLYSLSKKNGYKVIELDNNIVGRYSVLSSVGMLPLAFLGVNINNIMKGARAASKESSVYKYAAYRYSLYNSGLMVDILAIYSNSLLHFAEWWKQLFGESEGKEGKGLFPTSLLFTRDLHSLGQYLQEGKKMFFETVLSFKKDKEITLPNNYSGNFNYLNGKDISSINRDAMFSVMDAHYKGGTPVIHIEIEEKSEYSLGFLLYYFQKSCALSSSLLDVNPYDNRGVNDYKDSLKSKLLNKHSIKNVD